MIKKRGYKSIIDINERKRAEDIKYFAAIAIAFLFCLLSIISACAACFRLYRGKSGYAYYLPAIVPLIICVFSLFICRLQAKNALGTAVRFCLASACVLAAAIFAPYIASFFSSYSAIRAVISAYGAFAVPAYIVFEILQVIILPVPGIVSIAAGTYLFGVFLGGLYSFIGITTGSLIAFYIGRNFGRKAVNFLAGDGLEKFASKFKGKDKTLLAAMFILPFFPDDLLCFVAGLSSMSLKYFAVVMTLSRLISSFTASCFIGGVPLNTPFGIAVWCGVVVFFIAAYVIIKTRGKSIALWIQKITRNRRIGRLTALLKKNRSAKNAKG